MGFQKILDRRFTIPGLLSLVALVYYFALYSRQFTWLYTSGDAGDWLTQLRWWMVPHAFGSPLYISLVHLVGLSPYGTDVDKAMILSIIPAAITIGITYLIAYKLTTSKLKATAAALVLLGAAMFMSQATVVEEYALMAMFFSLFWYFFLTERRMLALVSLGLMTAVHGLGIVIFVLFMILIVAKHKEYKLWVKPITVYICIGALPYLLILGMMQADTPKLLAGDLSFITVTEYLLGLSSTNNLAIQALPQRLLEAARVFILSLGFGIVPLFIARNKLNNQIFILVVAIVGITLWHYLSNWFPSVWKYPTVVLPMICGFIALGLTYMKHWHTIAVITCAVALIITNAFLFNTNELAKERPLASSYVEFLEELPDGTGVVVPRGGAYGFGLFYAMSKENDLVPIISRIAKLNSPTVQSYLMWMEKQYNIKDETLEGIITTHINKGHEVYVPNAGRELTSDLETLGFKTELVDNPHEIYKVALK